jgi:hypothetical protein
MTVKIKKIEYLVAPKDLLNDAVDVLVDLEDDSDEFGYVVEVTTPQFLLTIMEKEKSAFLSPDYPCIIVSKLTDDIIRAAIESFINPQDSGNIYEELYWLKLYHLIPSLEMEDVNELYNRKKQESIELEAEVDAEFEAESDTKD